MKFHTRRVAAIVLATALSLPVFAAGISRDDRNNPGFDIPQRIVRVIRSVQKFFGISANSDAPFPPRP